MTRGGIALVAAALVLPTLALRAAPLDKDDCARLKTEQSQLEQAGTRGGMGRGPEWAKANLAPDKLEQIRRLIEVDEQLLFRCQGKPLVNLPKDPDPAAREPDGKDVPKTPVAKAVKAPGAEKAATPVKKAAAPKPEQSAKAVPKEAAAPKKDQAAAPPKKEGTDGQTAPAKAAKAKPKPKANDAWSNPLADFLAPPPPPAKK